MIRAALVLALCITAPSLAFAQPQRIERNVARSKSTLADALAERNWKPGEIVITQGYASAGDGGGGKFTYRDSGWSSLTAAQQSYGGFYIRFSGTDAYLEAVDKKRAVAQQFGFSASATGANNRSYLNSAIDAVGANGGGDVIVLPGTYTLEVDSTNRIEVDANIRLELEGVTVNQTVTAGQSSYQLFRLAGNGAAISGPAVINLDRTDGDLSGESGHGVYVPAVKNCLIEDLEINDSFGDGVYIRSDPNFDMGLVVQRVRIDNSRRNGLGIIEGEGIIVRDCSFTNTNGTSPEEGIDVEPNVGELVRNIQFLNCRFSGNNGGGLVVRSGVAGRLADGTAATKAVVIDGCDFFGQAGIQALGIDTADNVTIANCTGLVHGGMSLEDCNEVTVSHNSDIALGYVASCKNITIDSNVFKSPKRLVTFSSATDLFTDSTRTHPDNELVKLSNLYGGTLPTGFSSNTNYYVVNSTGNSFQLSTSLGGSAVDGSSDGSGEFWLTGYDSALRVVSSTGNANENVIVANNHVINAGGHGIEFASCTNFSVTNNDIGGSGQAAITNEGSGLYLNTCSQGIVRDNYIHGTGSEFNFCVALITCLGIRVEDNRFDPAPIFYRAQASSGATTTVIPFRQLSLGDSTDLLNGLELRYGSSEQTVLDSTATQATLDAALSGAPSQFDNLTIASYGFTEWTRELVEIGSLTRNCVIANNDMPYYQTQAVADNPASSTNQIYGNLIAIGGSVRRVPVGFAQISIEDNATATTVGSTQSDWSAKSQFVGFASNFSDSIDATPDHTNDHITLTSAGTWEVSCVVTLSGSVVSDLWELAIWKNNGASQVSTKQGVNIRGAGLTYEKQVTISGLVDASANDTIELWVQRTNGTGTLTITNAVMTATKVSD